MNNNLIRLLEEETGDKAVETAVDIQTESIDTPETVWEKICTFPFDSGWICLTDKVLALYSADDLANAGSGIILSAELAGQTQSLHIRQAENGWNSITITIGTGKPCLVLAESYLSTKNKQQDHLHYQVFWQESDDGTYRPSVARLAGLVKGGTN